VHARVVRFEGGDPELVSRTVVQIGGETASGPPEGVPAVGLMILHNPDDGKVLAITLFDTEDDMRQGDAALNAMEPPTPGGMGRRVSVEMFNVGVKVDI
jgi:hypothetical protein